MAFSIKKLIDDVFEPASNEILTIMIDIPHDGVLDNPEWEKRREMAEEWLVKINEISSHWSMKVNPIVTYNATGSQNSDLPDTCYINSKEESMEKVIEQSTIILSMVEFSATAPLYEYSLKLKKLRVASMPGAAKFMEETGLSADYKEISKKCEDFLKIFQKAKGAEVHFSTGHFCYFDLKADTAFIDDGILHPQMGGTEKSCSNLPAGEVYCVPNEGKMSLTRGELPFKSGNETGVFVVEANRIIDVLGEGPDIEQIRLAFANEKAMQNIAEFAVGVNEKAIVTGNVLQDEKAGFHWAYGRSDHLGGTVGVKDFSSPKNVVHTDIVYAQGNPIICSKLDMVFSDNSKQTIIENGLLLV